MSRNSLPTVPDSFRVEYSKIPFFIFKDGSQREDKAASTQDCEIACNQRMITFLLLQVISLATDQGKAANHSASQQGRVIVCGRHMHCHSTENSSFGHEGSSLVLLGTELLS